jgi:hypothetical protein
MKYRIHVYATVRVPYTVEAETPLKALAIVRELIHDNDQMTLSSRIDDGDGEYADDYESDVIIDENSAAGELIKSWTADIQADKMSGLRRTA